VCVLLGGDLVLEHSHGILNGLDSFFGGAVRRSLRVQLVFECSQLALPFLLLEFEILVELPREVLKFILVVVLHLALLLLLLVFERAKLLLLLVVELLAQAV